MNIVFLCPPASTINGGTKCLYRMASLLAKEGHEVTMFEQEGRRPTWFPTDLPVVGQGHFIPRADQVFVLPEDQPNLLTSIKDWPQTKVVYSQNHFYGAIGIGDEEGYASYGVTHILCSSRTIFDHAFLRHPSLKAYLIPCVIDRQIFKPSASDRRRQIAYMPRKRGIEAVYLRDMFRFLYPDLRDWLWQPIVDKSESETAQVLRESDVFLSLSRLEGFGLTPLEAMASGCVVAGFTGGGGWEYATDGNGFWADEDDFPSCIAQLKNAVDLALESKNASSEQRDIYRKNVEETLARYTPETFQQAILSAWNDIAAASKAV